MITIGDSFIDPQDIEILNFDGDNHEDINVSAIVNDNVTSDRNMGDNLNNRRPIEIEDNDNSYPDGKWGTI